MSNTILWIILGYLSGCILYSQLASRLFQVPDITKLSSDGNPGVFNVFQNGGFAVGLFTLAGDLLKGALPLFLWRMTTPGWKENTLLPLVMAAPVIGTLWPAFRHFSGGKGITVSFSVLLGLVPDWRPVLLLAACFLFFSLILVVDSHYYRTLVAFTAFPAGACLSDGCDKRDEISHRIPRRRVSLWPATDAHRGMPPAFPLRAHKSRAETPRSRNPGGTPVMEALILSCSTGGGHNAAAKAVQDALSRQGHHAILLDPYSLQGQAVADKVGRFYVDFVRTVPRLFGVVYKLGEAYTKLQEHLPHHSPVYLFQRKTARMLKQYLEKSQPDVIVTTHVFAGEMLTMLRNEGMKLPPVIYIATDYTSIPFTQEVQADRYIVGHKDIVQSFVAAGLPEWKILPYGIPVNEAFQSRMSRLDACRWLRLDPAKRHILLSGGSMGFGLDGMIRTLLPVLEEHPDTVLLVLTGSNEELQKSIHEKYPGPQIRALGPTDQMPRYLQACQVLITKPGGLSTTEACVSQIPMVLVHPIPGVETINARFFESHAMARWARDPEQDLADILREVLADPGPMEQAQATLQSNAALRTASLCSSLVRRKG